MSRQRRYLHLVAIVAGAIVACVSIVATSPAAVSAAAVPAATVTSRMPSAPTPTKPVTYRGYHVDVPETWPVVDLAANPRTCVRLDQPAIFLGHPGDVQDCPQQVLGRSDVIVIEPADAQAAADRHVAVDAHAGTSPAPTAAEAAEQLMRVHVTDAGVVVTEAWGADRAVVDAVVRSGRSGSAPVKPSPQVQAPSTAGPSSTSPPTSTTSGSPTSTGATVTTNPPTTAAQTTTSSAPTTSTTAPPPALRAPAAAAAVAPVTHAQFALGEGFDACSVPSSTATMSNLRAATGWVTVGMYLGGANAGCPQLGLGASWVQSVAAQGWAIVPIWVGRQINTCGGYCSTITPSQAGSQGAAEASAAAGAAQSVGIGPTSPIYYDLEGYNVSGTNTLTAIAFIQGWTNQLHAMGYTSGFYSSAASGIADMVTMAQNGISGTPDELWIARYDCISTTSDSAVPASLWVNHRMKQYRSNLTSCSAPQLNVGFGYDSDSIGGNAAGSGAGGFPAFVNKIYEDYLGRAADPVGLSGWVGALQNGMSLFTFVYSIANSPEHMGTVAAADYLRYLRRGIDPVGLQGWTNFLVFTHRNDLIEAGFLASDEYWNNFGHQNTATWLSQVYLDALGRPIDPSGMYGWTAALQAGTSRLAVATALVQSFEGAEVQVDQGYQEALHRAADPVGRSGWATVFIQTNYNLAYLEAALGSSWESWSASQS